MDLGDETRIISKLPCIQLVLCCRLGIDNSNVAPGSDNCTILAQIPYIFNAGENSQEYWNLNKNISAMLSSDGPTIQAEKYHKFSTVETIARVLDLCTQLM